MVGLVAALQAVMVAKQAHVVNAGCQVDGVPG
jgi:hypothetical protein